MISSLEGAARTAGEKKVRKESERQMIAHSIMMLDV